MKKVAVIPARGGSTRLKDKNIHPLGDKPLIRWMTEAVVESESFDSIIISTDSDQIFDAVSDLPVERHERPEAHATTKATVLDAIIQLMKTCSKDDIKKGIKKLSGKNIDSVISMTELQDTLQLACQMSGDKVLPVLDNLECGLTNSKFIKKYYKPSGAFYMSKWDHLIENRNFFKGNVKGVLIPKERSIDINDKYDILFAESILRGDTTQ